MGLESQIERLESVILTVESQTVRLESQTWNQKPPAEPRDQHRITVLESQVLIPSKKERPSPLACIRWNQ